MDALRYFEGSDTRGSVPVSWNASTGQVFEAATSVITSVRDLVNRVTKSESTLSSIGAALNSAVSAASPVTSIGILLRSATGAAYVAFPDVATSIAFLDAVSAERAGSTDPAQEIVETDSINEKLHQYESLKDGWLSECSKAPGIVAVTRARKLYESTKRNGYPPVRCYVSPDGEVGLIWQKGSGYGNVGFWSDGSLVYYVRRTDGTEVRDDLDMDGGDLPGALIKALRTF